MKLIYRWVSVEGRIFFQVLWVDPTYSSNPVPYMSENKVLIDCDSRVHLAGRSIILPDLREEEGYIPILREIAGTSLDLRKSLHEWASQCISWDLSERASGPVRTYAYCGINPDLWDTEGYLDSFENLRLQDFSFTSKHLSCLLFASKNKVFMQIHHCSEALKQATRTCSIRLNRDVKLSTYDYPEVTEYEICLRGEYSNMDWRVASRAHHQAPVVARNLRESILANLDLIDEKCRSPDSVEVTDSHLRRTFEDFNKVYTV